jgi:Hint domain
MGLRQSLGPNGFKITRRNVMAIGSILAASVLEGCHTETLRHDFFRQYDHRHEPNCYLKSTQILTGNGYKRIEEVEIGERVITKNHGQRRIQWIGRRCCLPGPDGAWMQGVKPIKIARNAFGDKVPDADLFVSQGHRIYLHDMLIRAVDLVNGNTVSIADGNNFDKITYFHLLTEEGHCIIYAQNTPSESLLFDEKTVRRFDNWSSNVFESLSRSGAAPDTICAPLFTCNNFGGRAMLRSHLRSALSPWIDRRSQSDKARDHLMDGQYGTIPVPGEALAGMAAI